MNLTPRWAPLRAHEGQRSLMTSRARFRVVAAGRRSGKTELLKRHLVMAALVPPNVDTPTFVAAAPTRDQAKRIFWDDLKALSPREWVQSIRESEMAITYKTTARLIVVGLDRPQRIEGIAVDGIGIDEIAEVRRESWEQSIRPALSTTNRPPGWAWFTGRPKGRGLFHELYSRAGTMQGWESFTWTSSTVVDASEIDQARQDLDPMTFAQEYDAKWVSFQGLAYYQWDPAANLRRIKLDPNLPLIVALDFNVEPGVAAILQEQVHGGESATCVVGEIHIPRNSNTPAICRAIVAKYPHAGDVLVYGDPAGGARHTSQENLRTDWHLVRDILGKAYGTRLKIRVPSRAPYVRDRINAVNSRLRSTAGTVRLLVDPQAAPNVVRDFEGVQLLEGGSGEVDKAGGERQGLTHLTDAIGYYIAERYPIDGRISGVS